MATVATNIRGFKAAYDGVITADVYVGQEKIAEPGDAVEVGDIAQGGRTLCRLSGSFYWIENGSWSVE